MSFARTFVKIIFTILLVIALIVSVFSLSLFQLTSPNNLKPSANMMIGQEISQRYNELTPEEIADARAEIIEKCLGKEKAVISLTAAKASNDFVNETEINCTGIDNESSNEQLIKALSEGITNSLYEKEYDCGLASCISENPLSMVSQKINNFFKIYLILSAVLLAILIFFIVLFSKPKFTCFYNLSAAFLISGIFFLLKFLISAFIKTLGLPDFILSQVDYFINSLFVNFLIVFILGIIFLILGIVLKKRQKR